MTRLKDGESREYVVPLRQEWLKVPKWRRSKRAVAALQQFMFRHTKADSIKMSRWVNELIWQHGGKNPPAKIKVSVKKEKEFASVELAELPAKAKRLEEKKAEAEKKKAKLVEKLKEKAEKKKKAKEDKKEKKAEKKKSQKELLADLEAAKEAEKKKQAKMTKKQEMQMKK